MGDPITEKEAFPDEPMECRRCPISRSRCQGDCIYAEILENINLGIIGLDSERQEVFYQNRLARELFSATMKSRNYHAIVSLLLPDFLDKPGMPPTESPARTIQYGNRLVGYTVYRISDRYYWIYVLDITEKERLKSIAQAVNTMNTTGYIFSGIRHELGNPVNSIKMTLHVLRKNAEKYTPGEVVHYVDRALSEVDRTEYLLRALRNFSMYETPEIEDVNVPAFIDRFMSMATPDFKARGITVRTVNRSGYAWGRFDPRALQQVLLNLLANSSDALENVENPGITITVAESNERIAISVRDNGCGIETAQLEDIYNPFYTTKPNGTGLGMVVVRKMMASMSGTVDVESQLNVGTTVTLTFPAGKPC